MKKLRFFETCGITHPAHIVTNQKALILSKTAGRPSYTGSASESGEFYVLKKLKVLDIVIQLHL